MNVDAWLAKAKRLCGDVATCRDVHWLTQRAEHAHEALLLARRVLIWATESHGRDRRRMELDDFAIAMLCAIQRQIAKYDWQHARDSLTDVGVSNPRCSERVAFYAIISAAILAIPKITFKPPKPKA